MPKQSRCGHALTETFGEHSTAPSPVYLTTANGAGTGLLPYTSAAALLEHVTASPLNTVTGDLTLGFAWPVPGARPRRSYAVIPLAAPVWPNTPYPTAVTVELWWPPDQDGYRHVRSFLVWADAPYYAYRIACCLWSTAATGAGAEAAYLYGPDRRTAYRVNNFAKTCSQIPESYVAAIAATAADRDTTDPLPDSPQPAAAVLEEERVS
ncbi:hypothetical protein KGQ19_15920 [Catenulispora sp. NL8]|uniref:Uncharacterized protein n=1 Tax=Catenulispora pinistramenti TaxID=2705254 RepID=A0ABS5KQM8_9ACTN|nr:hypothetical protein [Catenulispora pinistramenti]MBS2548353.1 hypothetical protein [Catenulispora pinistramenti]